MGTMYVVAVTVVVGVLVGVELSVAVFLNPIFNRLPGDAGLRGRVDGARVLGRVMPYWYCVSTVAAAVWAVAARDPRVGLAAGLLVVSVVMSVALLVPINNRIRTWATPDGALVAPADWRDQVGRWERLHVARVGILVAAFTLLVVAAR